MKKLVIICCLSLTLGYASNLEVKTISQTENSEINTKEIKYLSLTEFLNEPFQELY